MTRTATWNALGTDVSTCTTITDVLTASNLNYIVEKQPIYIADGIQVPGKMATVRTDTNQPLGVVSKNYTIYQNADAFDFIGNIQDVQFVKAGQTKTGMVYIIGKLPSVTVLDDTFTPYVIFQTSHNGMFTVRATICPLRIVCQNQFAMSFRESNNTISIHHSSQLPQKIAQAQQLLNETAAYMTTFNNTAEELATLKITSKTDVKRIIDAFFKVTTEMTERQLNAVERQRVEFLQAYQNDDNSNFRGTAWGLINAYTDYTTHRERKKTKNSVESTFLSVTFDTRSVDNLIDIIKNVA